MINAAARNSLDALMQFSLHSSIASATPQASVHKVPRVEPAAASQMVVLSIASYAFKLIAALHFSPTPQMRELAARLCRRPADRMTQQDFIDALCEAGNMCCGAINHELSAFFPCLGLSPPQTLDARSLPFLERLGCQYVQHFRIEDDAGLQLHASLCAKAYEEMDFHWETVAAHQPAGGELELF